MLADHGTWSNPQLQALVQTHARLIQEYKCVERQPQGPAQAAPVVDQGPQVHSPLLPLLTNWPSCAQQEPTGKTLKTLRKRLHKACGCWINGKSRQQS